MEVSMILSEKKQKLTGPEAVVKTMKALRENFDVEERDKEHFYCFGLNNKNVILYVDLVAIGLVNEIHIHPREVFRRAVSKSCVSILVAHNHPSGEVTPSKEDTSFTEKLRDAGKILSIELLDHVIFSDDSEEFYSFKEAGYI